MAPGGPAGAPPPRSTRLEPCPWALGDVGMQIGMCRAWNARFSDLLGIYLGKSFIIIIRDNYFHLRPVLQRLGFSAANSCALGGFRCTKLEWLNPTQQGTRADVPLALLSKLLYETTNYYTR